MVGQLCQMVAFSCPLSKLQNNFPASVEIGYQLVEAKEWPVVLPMNRHPFYNMENKFSSIV